MNIAAKRSLVLLVLFVSTLAMQPSCSASEQDVHYGLTYWLARKAGFSASDARIIASAAESYDEGSVAPATYAVAHVLLAGDPTAPVLVQLQHFPSDGAMPSSSASRTVWPGNEVAKLEVEHGKDFLQKLSRDERRRQFALTMFGQSLHPYEDSWAHKGEPDRPFRPEYISKGDRTFAHPCARGGWWSHDADLTHLNRIDVHLMAEAVYGQLKDALSKNPHLAAAAPSAWSDLLPKVVSFADLSSKQEKRKWFESDPSVPIGEYPEDFLNKITLPEKPELAAYAKANRPVPQDTCNWGFWDITTTYFKGEFRNGVWAVKEALKKKDSRIKDIAQADIVATTYLTATYLNVSLKEAVDQTDLRGQKDPTSRNGNHVDPAMMTAGLGNPDHGATNALGNGFRPDSALLSLYQKQYTGDAKPHSLEQVLRAPQDVLFEIRNSDWNEFLNSQSKSGSGPSAKRPFFITHVKRSLLNPGTLTYGLNGPVYAAIYISEYAPNDTNILLIANTKAGWKIRRIYSLAG